MTTLHPDAVRILQLLHAGHSVQEVERLTATPATAIRTMASRQRGWLINSTGHVHNPGGKIALPEGIKPLSKAELDAILNPTPRARPRPAAVTPAGQQGNGGGVDALLAEAEKIDDSRVQAAVGAVRAALDVLRDRLHAVDERRQVEAEVAQLREQLAAAEARLKGLGGKTRRAAGAASAGRPSDREIRAWFAEQGLECPANGRLPQTFRDQYAEAAS